MTLDFFMIGWTLATTLGGALVSGAIYYRRGVKRGREMERMEPPPKGRMYFRDGKVAQLVALDASDALDQLRQHAERDDWRGHYFEMGGWG